MIYEAILRSEEDAMAAGERPSGIRMGREAFALLKAEIDYGLVREEKTSWGDKVTTLETEYGRLRLLFDDKLGEGFILTCAMQPVWRAKHREEENA